MVAAIAEGMQYQPLYYYTHTNTAHTHTHSRSIQWGEFVCVYGWCNVYFVVFLTLDECVLHECGCVCVVYIRQNVHPHLCSQFVCLSAHLSICVLKCKSFTMCMWMCVCVSTWQLISIFVFIMTPNNDKMYNFFYRHFFIFDASIVICKLYFFCGYHWITNRKCSVSVKWKSTVAPFYQDAYFVCVFFQ